MAKHWDKIKIPPVGMSDGMVEYLRSGKKKQTKEKDYEEFRAEVLKEIKTDLIPRYVKVIDWCVYSEFWLGIKKENIGSVYRTDEHEEKWMQALKIFPECYEPATKIQWNLSRNHGTPPPATDNSKKEVDWDWESYDESIKLRAEQLRKKNIKTEKSCAQ